MRDAAPSEITFDAGGLRLAALAWGPRDAPLALCLHGYPDTAWTWRHLGPRLAAEGRRVVAPFLRGYAPSGLADDWDYGVEALAADAIATHEAIGTGEPAVLVGHDWGALAAYAAARRAPERFARLIAMAVPPGPVLTAALRGDPRLALRQARCSWYIGFQQLPGISERSLGRLIPRLWRAWSPGYAAREDVERVLVSLAGPKRRSAALSYYRALARNLGRVPSPPREGPPLLYVHGRDDGCMLAELVDRGRERFPAGARVETIDGAGHFAHLERPDVIADLIVSFI